MNNIYACIEVPKVRGCPSNIVWGVLKFGEGKQLEVTYMKIVSESHQEKCLPMLSRQC